MEILVCRTGPFIPDDTNARACRRSNPYPVSGMQCLPPPKVAWCRLGIATVQRMAGHAKIQTTARYGSRGEDAKRRAAEVVHVPLAGFWGEGGALLRTTLIGEDPAGPALGLLGGGEATPI